MKFSLGSILATPGAIEFAKEHGINILHLINRHANGDWGDLDQQDKQANEAALKHGLRLFSAYQFPTGKLWVITEADHSATTVLLPEEY